MSRPRRSPRRSPRRLVALAVVAVSFLVVAACTPEQFQQWWTARGHAPLQEPQLSSAAAAATRYWAEVARRNRFTFAASRIDGALAARMTPTSWRPGCPVPLSALRHLRVSYLGADGGEHSGELVLNADAVLAAIALFRALWDEQFPITRMQLVDDFGGSDDASMAADNTSAFNCRAATGSTSWSQHAYGRAIDINPVENPWVSGTTVLPPVGTPFVDRSVLRPGMIVPGDVVTRTVRTLGWGWGGSWSSVRDYMHVSSTGR
jgi:hypothetical protein